MELNIAVSPGELIDKITILEIKQARFSDPAQLRNVTHEYDVLSLAAVANITASPRLTELRAALKAINETLWQVEEDLRDHERRQAFDQKFIAAARLVYISNDKRAALKRQINELLGSRLVEEKSYDSGRSV
jgi:hypothetical protein